MKLFKNTWMNLVQKCACVRHVPLWWRAAIISTRYSTELIIILLDLWLLINSLHQTLNIRYYRSSNISELSCFLLQKMTHYCNIWHSVVPQWTNLNTSLSRGDGFTIVIDFLGFLYEIRKKTLYVETTFICPTVRLSLTKYQRVNRFLLFYELDCRGSMQSVVEKARISWKLDHLQCTWASLNFYPYFQYFLTD
jgi:hypothetical protein